MTTSTLSFPVNATALDDEIMSIWTDELTKSDAEYLLDQLETLGFPFVEVRCTEHGLFGVHVPRGAASFLSCGGERSRKGGVPRGANLAG